MSTRITFIFTLILPLFASAATLNIAVTPTDRTTPLPCRVHLENSAGEAILPEGYPAFKTHFTCEGNATLTLPPGSYTYALEKGPEFTRATGTVKIGDNAPETIAASLQRIAHMAAEGWWSGDLHVHRPPEDMEVLMRAEDLHIAPVITWWNKKNRWQGKPRAIDHYCDRIPVRRRLATR